MSSSPTKTFTNERMFPCSSNKCFLRSGKLCVNSLTTPFTFPALIFTLAVLFVNFRNGVGMIIVAILFVLICDQLVFYFFFFKLKIVVKLPGTDIGNFFFLHRNNDVRKI